MLASNSSFLDTRKPGLITLVKPSLTATSHVFLQVFGDSITLAPKDFNQASSGPLPEYLRLVGNSNHEVIREECQELDLLES